MHSGNETEAEAYLKGLREQFPDIRPYDEDDWDWTWADEGWTFLEACDFGMAELTFQRLIAARPQDPDGFEGLAMVYKALGVPAQARVLIDEAVALAERQLATDMLDQEVVDEIKAAQRAILDMSATPPPSPAASADEDDDDMDAAGKGPSK